MVTNIGEDEEEEARETRSESFASVVGYSTLKISRKEADKVVVPNWPRIHELEFWKSQVTANIVAASGDLDHDAWTSWIAPTFKISPDIEGDLAGSGDVRYNSVDVKLASALMAMMQNGGDQTREVLDETRLKMAKGCRGGTPTILKGRQLLAMIVDSFRSASNTDLVFTIRHFYDLPYPGNNDLANPSGKRIDLHSKDDIPYLIPGEGSGPHDDQLATDIHELLNRKVVVTDAPAVAGEGGEDEGDGPDVAEAEDDGLIEVDVHEGEQKMAKPGVLKA